MYPLFQLVRLISVKQDIHEVHIKTHAWGQHGEISLLALACSNGFILLRYSCNEEPSVTKQLSWPPDLPITSMTFDPTVSWLLVQVNNGNIFVIPALPMLAPGSQVNQLWRIDDVTIVTCMTPRGIPTVTVWWHTLDDQHIAIVATNLGELLFVNLLSQQLVTQTGVDGSIKHIELVQDDLQTSTHLLITGKSGQQWKMLLEKRSAEVSCSPDTELSDLGYEKIDGLNLPIISILNRQEEIDWDLFTPKAFDAFSRSVTLLPQYAKGRHFVAAHCDKNSTFQVYDSNIEHSPLFVYKLPVGSLGVIYTDRLLFTASKLGGEQKLLVLSNQRAESSEDSEDDFNKTAILQQFEFPADEKLLSILPKSFPFYWHGKLEEQQIKLSQDQDEDQSVSMATKMPSAIGIYLNSHTVLDGCIIVTTSTVYECRPSISPERLFLELCVSQSDALFAEQLGISLSLDLNFLLEIAADFLLRHGNSKQATRLFHMSKGSPIKRVSSFAKYGYIEEILPFLQQLLSKDNMDVSGEDKRQLTDLALHGLVYKLKHDVHNTEMNNTLSQFLMSMFDYEDNLRSTLQLLAEHRLENILIQFAMARGVVIDALEVISQLGQYKLTTQSLDLLITKGFSIHLAQVASGAFLHCLDSHHLVTVFCDKPQLVAQYPHLLLGNLSNLDIGALLRLAEVLDPSRPSNQGYIRRKISSKRRTSSLTSLTGSGEYGEAAQKKELRTIDAWTMIHCFFMVVLYLNNKRKQCGEPVNTDFLFDNPEDLLQNILGSSQKSQHKLSCKPNPIGCGQSHAAVVKHGDLYTWGKSQHGRLGQGDSSNQESASPCRVDSLNMLQIKVVSVACGLEHTIALTQQGVYGWGSSKYGQVGVNSRHVYTRPMLIEGLSKVICVAVDCGQYHTLALTDEAQVYSWGWGVHGQLGHGDTEERMVPKLVNSLENQSVVRIAAGYCHSLVLNMQGELYAFGCGFFGQLGLGTTVKHTTPTKIHTLTERIVTMATKYFHSLALGVNNHVYQWGCHPHGLRHFVHTQRRNRQSGQPMFEQADTHLKPVLVDTTYVNGKIKQVVCGSFHSCILTRDGDVYAWGRNIDGQIGNGNRQDVRVPQMVTHINDRHVSHLTSGGEFNVAMDTDTQVWVWGKNDNGQLGIQSSDITISSKGYKSVSKNVNQPLTEVVIPTLLPHLASSWQHDQSSFSLTESMLSPMSIVEDREDDDDDAGDVTLYLPNLSTVGRVPDTLYDRTVIPVMLQCMGTACDCNQMLRECVDLQDWCLATAVNLYMQNYTQALGYHLLCARDQPPKGDTAVDMALRIIHHYYSLVLENASTTERKEESLRNMLYQVLYHWEVVGLPTSDLEKCLLDTLTDTAPLLATIIFRKPQTSQKDNQEVKPRLFHPTPAFLSTFTTKFCFKVSSTVLHQIHNDLDKTQPTTFTDLKQLGGDNFATIPTSMLDEDKLPYDHLWQDILQNLRKGHDARKYIYVTHSELDRLQGQGHLQGQINDSHEEVKGQKKSAVFFTCGHYYTKKVFTAEVERFCRDLRSGKEKFPESVSVFSEYYSRKGCVPLACPSCVYSAINVLA